MSEALVDGWYRIIDPDGMLYNAIGWIGEGGMDTEYYLKNGYTFQPLVVLTVAEHAALQAELTEVKTWRKIWKDGARRFRYKWLNVLNAWAHLAKTVKWWEEESRKQDDTIQRLEHERYTLQAEVAALRAQVVDLQETLEFASTYKGIEGRSCPLCHYDNGVFVESCQMHKDMDELRAQVGQEGMTTAEEDALRYVLMIVNRTVTTTDGRPCAEVNVLRAWLQRRKEVAG